MRSPMQQALAVIGIGIVGVMLMGAGGLSGGGGANFSSVASSIIPAANITYDVGSTTKAFVAGFFTGLRDSANNVRLQIANTSASWLGGASGAAGPGVQFFNFTTLTSGDIAQFYKDALLTKVANIDFSGRAFVTGVSVTATTGGGTITLSAGSGTATVLTGARCVCTDTTANASVKCAVTTTTLTATGTGTDVIAYLCF